MIDSLGFLCMPDRVLPCQREGQNILTTAWYLQPEDKEKIADQGKQQQLLDNQHYSSQPSQKRTMESPPPMPINVKADPLVYPLQDVIENSNRPSSLVSKNAE